MIDDGRRREETAAPRLFLQQHEGAHGVGSDELAWAVDGAVDMALGRGIHRRVRLVFFKQAAKLSIVANAGLLEGIRTVISTSRSMLEGAGYGHQIFAIAALGGLARHLVELRQRDVALSQRNLLRTGNTQALALLQNLHEMARLDQRGVGSGIEPGKSAPEHL